MKYLYIYSHFKSFCTYSCSNLAKNLNKITKKEPYAISKAVVQIQKNTGNPQTVRARGSYKHNPNQF